MSIDPAAIRHEPHPRGGRFFHRFEDGSVAELDYSEETPGVVGILHTGTPPKHRNQGVAATMVEHAIEDFRSRGLKVVPRCSFAREQFALHPEWSDLLLRR